MKKNVMKNLKRSIPFFTSVMLMSCSGSSETETPVAVVPEPTTKVVVPDPGTKVPDPGTKVPDPGTKVPDPGTKAVVIVPEPETTTPALTLTFTPTKNFHFTWIKVTGATSYKIQEDINSDGDYQDITTTTVAARSFDHIVPLYARVNARYILQSCIEDECTSSEVVHTSSRLTDMTSSIGYVKASNTGVLDTFGTSVSLSDDGNTLAVGAQGESSSSRGINQAQDNDSAISSGAVYVFTRDNTSAGWSQQAYLKASNAGEIHYFGRSVSLSENGNTLVVGAVGEDSPAIGINAPAADQANNRALNAGAAYVFIRTGAGTDDVMWEQQAYLKASNTDGSDNFGHNVSLSDDGNTLAVGSPGERSSAAWLDNTLLDQTINSSEHAEAGAAYVFLRTGAGTNAVMWKQQAYLKATDTQIRTKFGLSVSLNDDGSTLAVGAVGETGGEGAVYVFLRNGATWSYQDKLKATNKETNDQFGGSVSISADGNTLAVGAIGEDSSATGVSTPSIGPGNDNDDAVASGAAYVFFRTGAGTNAVMWEQQAYLKASNPDVFDYFGHSISISADGNTLAVGAYSEDSGATGINNEDDGNVATPGFEETNTGAVYTFTRSDDTTWSPQAYIKANNTDEDDEFGYSLALSADGGILAVSAWHEGSNAKDVNGDKDNDEAENAGAVYLY